MPLIVQAVLAWIAGIGGGRAHPAALALAACAVALCAGQAAHASPATRVTRRTRLALAAVTLGGAAMGDAAAAREAACLPPPGSVTVTARLRAPARPGAMVPADALGDGCRVPLALQVRAGSAAAGAQVRAIGRLQGGARPALLEARLATVAPPGALDRLRAAASSRIARRFREGDVPLVRALLIAETRDLDPALRERFADAGLVHVLSISGLHVAIVAGAVRLLLEALRLRRRAAAVAAAAIAIGYVALIGAPPPAVRSAVMLAADVAARWRRHPTDPWAVLALGAVIPVCLDPRAVADLGWQLSVAGMAALVAAGEGWRRWRVAARARALHGTPPRPLPAWGRALVRELATSTLATLVTMPLVAWHFGRLGLAGPLANLGAAPVVAVLQPALFLGLVLPHDAAGRWVGDAAHPLLAALDAVAAAAAAIPGAALAVQPTPVVALLGGLAALALLAMVARLEGGRAAWVALGALALAAWWPAPRHSDSGGMELHMLDVGQGDALAIRTPRGRWILVDAGRGWRTGDAGRSTVLPYLRRAGGAVAAFVLTHPHADHAGGAASVLDAVRPGRFLDAAFLGGSATYRDALQRARDRRIPWRRVRPGERFMVDSVECTVLAPDSAWTAGLTDANEASVVLRVRYGAVRLLLMGDAERGEERWLLDRWPAESLTATVLKVGHHGSRTSTTPAFLAAVRPRLALVSVGAANGYGHPGPEVMRALVAAGVTVLRTDQLGTVVLATDGRAVTVRAAGVAWTPGLP